MSKTSAVAAKALTSNHFELFGLVPAFALDIARIEAAYREIQSKVHPDRFARAGDAERRASMQMTTRVNEAYRILTSPVRRAAHLLELNGVDVGLEANTAMPKDFLIKQIKLREQLEAASDTATLDFISKDLFVMKENLEREIENQIDKQGNPAGAIDAVRKLMFLERFGEDIDAAYESLET